MEKINGAKDDSGEIDMTMHGKSWSTWRRHNFEFFKKYLTETAGKTVVDLGAGDFLFPDLFRDAKYIGVDVVQSRLVSVVADINKTIPLSDGLADIIYASNTIEHIYNPDNVFRETFRILKPRGFFIGTVPFLRPLHCEPHDYLRYTPYMLRHLLSEAGFTDIKIDSLGSVTDMFRLSRDLFYTHAIENASGLKRVIFRLMRKLYKVLDRVLPRSVVSMSYTEGYGFR